MPMAMLKLKPGVDVELSPSLSEAAIHDSNLVRFRAGLAEKLGGWDRFYQFALSGVPKALHAWLDLNEVAYLAAGTTQALNVLSNGALRDITPQTLTSDFAPDFDTTNGSPNVIVNDPNVTAITIYNSVEFMTPVSVGGIVLSGVYPVDLFLGTGQYRIVAATDATATVVAGGVVPEFSTISGTTEVRVDFPAHGLEVGESANFPLATTLGGVTIFGTYDVIAVSSPDAYTIAATELATSTTSAFMNGGDVQIVYAIALGPVAAGSGYGIGPYGSGGYGTGTSTGVQTGAPITATDWTLDNWGEILLACPEGRGVYQWRPNSGIQNAQQIATAPAHNTGAFVSMQTQMLICYGASSKIGIGVDQDPLLVAWSNVGDFTDFTLGVASQAGSRRLSTGSRIVSGMSVQQQELLWTDLGLWSMSYLGSLQAGVWGFNQIGWGCGLIGKHAAARLGANVFWMSASNFYALLGSGAPQMIPCTLWDAVFQDLNTTHQHKCWAWANTPFNEVWFHYPRASTGATECDASVVYNIAEGVWYPNTDPSINRSAGIDQSIVGMPIAATPTGIIYEHEVSNDADGQPMNSWYKTGLFQLAEGQDMMFIDWWQPDMLWQKYGSSDPSAQINITISAYRYANSTPRVSPTYTVTSASPYFNPRLRGSLWEYTLGSNDIGSWWRTGGNRARINRDGRQTGR